MGKTVSAKAPCFGNSNNEHLRVRRPHFICDLSRATDKAALPKGRR
jgi:hypothetical protein